jgi:NCAIR mutase (PurE)-related protein
MSCRKRQQETSRTKPTKKTKPSSKDDLNTMGNMSKNCLLKEEYQVLYKAFEDYCRTVNITKKDFFLKINKQTWTEGWNVIIQKLHSDLIETIQSIMDVSKKPASQTAIASTENLPTMATNEIMANVATTTDMPMRANATTMMNVLTMAMNVATTTSRPAKS